MHSRKVVFLYLSAILALMDENKPRGWMQDKEWPPDGYTAVGDYAFAPPFIPTEEHIERAEQFIFIDSSFIELKEEERRRNVIRLAVAAATCIVLDTREGDRLYDFVPLIGGKTAKITIERHDDSPIFTYELLKEE
jgi:hypothetical protein